MTIADTLAKDVGTKPACSALAIARASYYRWKNKYRKPEKKYRPPLALSSEERGQVLDMLHDRRFIDMAPQEVYYTLLDSGRYLFALERCTGSLRPTKK